MFIKKKEWFSAQSVKNPGNMVWSTVLCFIILSAVLLLAGCVNEGKNENTYRQITMGEAVSLMQEESGYIILDVRRPDEFEEKHIPGALNIPNETIGTAEIPALPDKDQLILVYCRSGNRSKQASEKLVALGYTNIVEFGGIIDWTGETATGQEG